MQLYILGVLVFCLVGFFLLVCVGFFFFFFKDICYDPGPKFVFLVFGGGLLLQMLRPVSEFLHCTTLT